MSTEKKPKKKKADKALDHKCPSCGAPIRFQPSSGNWTCEYCNSSFTLEEMQKYNNASSEKNNQTKEDAAVEVDDYDEYVTYKCQDCGAEIIADSQTAATFCVYCGNTAILKDKLSGKFAPDFVIPFQKEKQEAEQAFAELAKGRPFVPKDFTDKKNIEKIKGVYIPFWLYDVDVSGSLNCDGKKVTSWTVGDTHYTKTDTYKLYRRGSMQFAKVPVDGSTRFNNDIMNSIEPFDYAGLIKYNHAYLSGFFAEKYDVESDEAFKDAEERTLASGKDIMYNDSVGFSGKVIKENTLQASINNKYYGLLPVWMVNVKYMGKMYIFAMNGQTGEFIGDIPLDKKKAILWAILIFIGVLLIAILVSYILFVMGGKL